MEYYYFYLITGLILACFTAKRCTDKEKADIPPLSWLWLVLSWPFPVLKGIYLGIAGGLEDAKAGANAPPFAPALRPFRECLPGIGTITSGVNLRPWQVTLLQTVQRDLHAAIEAHFADFSWWRKNHDAATLETEVRAFCCTWVAARIQPGPGVTLPRVDVVHDGFGFFTISLNWE